jgi:hypothetical protein
MTTLIHSVPTETVIKGHSLRGMLLTATLLRLYTLLSPHAILPSSVLGNAWFGREGHATQNQQVMLTGSLNGVQVHTRSSVVQRSAGKFKTNESKSVQLVVPHASNQPEADLSYYYSCTRIMPQNTYRVPLQFMHVNRLHA